MTRSTCSVAGLAVCVFAIAGLRGLAQETNADPYVRLAVARAKAEVALRDGAALCDGGRSGVDQAWDATEAAVERLNRTLEAAVEREESKEEDRRDESFLRVLRQTRERREEEWQAFQPKRADMRFRYEDCQKAFGRLSEIFDGSAELEKRWKDAGLDVALLEPMYDAMAARLADVDKRARAVAAEVAAGRQHWEDALADAKASAK